MSPVGKSADVIRRAAMPVTMEMLERRQLMTNTLLSGTPFGTNPAHAVGLEYEKAFDGSNNSYHQSSQANGAFVGIDLGNGNAQSLTVIRYVPQSGFASKMVGGKFQGSNASANSGFVDLAAVSLTPAAGWNELSVSGNPDSFRFLRYVGPDGSYARVAEVQFYADVPPSAPAAASSLSASAVSASQINLSWTDNAATETGYRLERKTGAGGTWAELETLAPNTTGYSDDDLLPGRTYFYRLRTENSGAGQWIYSNEVSATTHGRFAKLSGTVFGTRGAPGKEPEKIFDGDVNTSYQAGTTTSSFGIDLGTGNVQKVDKIRFYATPSFEHRLIGGKFQGSNTSATAGFVDIATVTDVPARGWNEMLIDDSLDFRYFRFLSPGTTYTVISEVELYSLLSNQDAPQAPSGLVASVGGAGRIDLSWTDNSSNETGFTIERRLGLRGTWEAVDAVAAGITEYSDEGLPAGRQYYYRVRANNGAEADWLFSNEVTATTPGTLVTLTGTSLGSSPNNSGNAQANAFDGSASTIFQSGTTSGANLGIDLGAGNQRALTVVRLLAAQSLEMRLAGAKIQGSNTSTTSGFVDLATVTTTPSANWNDVYIDSTTPYRFLRFLAPSGTYVSLAEIQFLAVDNVAPVATISGPATANEGSLVTFFADVTDPDSANLTYAWSVTKTGDPLFELPGNTPTDAEGISFIVPDNGQFVVSVTVSDGTDTSTATTNLSVANLAPGVTILIPPSTTYDAGEEVSLSALWSDPASGVADPIVPAWTLVRDSDGTTVATATGGSFDFIAPAIGGTYTVTVTVNDGDGGTDSHGLTLTVIPANVAPIVTITGASSSEEASPVVFGADLTDPDSVNFTYAWSVTKTGDPSYALPAGTITDAASFSFTPPDNGQYVVSVTVSDGTDATTTTRNLSVANLAPSGIAVTGLPSGVIASGTELHLTVTATDPAGPTADPLTFAWEVVRDNDGAISVTGSGASFDFTAPAEGGDYLITVTASDGDGGTDALGLVTTIAPPNLAPIVTIMGSDTVEQGTYQSYWASVEDTDSSEFTYAWEVLEPYTSVPGTPEPSSQSEIWFGSMDFGVYTIRVTVSDGTNTVVVDKIVTVPNAQPQSSLTNGGPVNEGSSGTVSFGEVTDIAQVAQVFKYSYDFNDDGTFEIVNSLSPTATVPASYLANGPSARPIFARVTDPQGAYAEYSTEITVNNVAPTTGITGGPTSATVDVPFTLGASATDPSAADTAAGFDYVWSVSGPATASALDQPTITITPTGVGMIVVTLVARDVDDASGSAATYSVNATGGSVGAPDAPASTSATPSGAGRIDVEWAAVIGAAGYLVQRSSTGTGSWQTIGAVGAGFNLYPDTGLTAGSTYHYRVIATGSGGSQSAPSPVAFATALADVAPLAPGELVAVGVSSNSIRLSWVRSDNMSGFEIRRSLTGSGEWATIATVDNAVTSYTDDDGLLPSTSYSYMVRAVGLGGESPYTTEAIASTQRATVTGPVGDGSAPSVGGLGLVEDTGTVGDNVTLRPIVRGSVSVGSGGSTRYLPVEFDLNNDGASDGTVYTAGDDTGEFVIDLSSFVVNAGIVNVRVRAGSPDADTGAVAFGAWSAFSFTYEIPAPPSGGGEVVRPVPSGSGTGTYVGPVIQPTIGTGADGSSPTDFFGGGSSVVGGTGFDAFSNRVNPTGGSSYTINLLDDDDTPITVVTSDGSGVYTTSTSDLSSRSVSSIVNPDGSWSYSETYTSSYIIETLFVGGDGTRWHRIQTGGETRTLDASGNASGSSYDADQDRWQAYDYEWKSAIADPQRTYDSDGYEGFEFDASGTAAFGPLGTTTHDEFTYLAGGNDSSVNKSKTSGGGVQNDDENTRESTWTYFSFTEVAYAAGAAAATKLVNYNFDRSTKTHDRNTRTEDITTTTNVGGLSETTTSVGTSELIADHESTSGGAGLAGYNADGTWWAWTNVDYTEDTGDVFSSSFVRTIDSTDNSVAGITVTASGTTTANSDRDRKYHQENDSTTWMVNGVIVSFEQKSKGTNQSDASWDRGATSNASGNDEATAGVKRSFTSTRSSTEDGESHYFFTSEGTRHVNALGMTTVTGSSKSNQSASGNSTWDNADNSEVETNSTTTSGGVTVTVTTKGDSASTDVGSGSHSNSAESSVIGLTGGAQIKSGSAKYLATTNGATTEAHNDESNSLTIDKTNPYGATRTTTAEGTSSYSESGSYSSTSKGEATYGGDAVDSFITSSSGENGSDSSQKGTIVVSGKTAAGVTTESTETTTVTDNRTGTYAASQESTTTTRPDGLRSWNESREDSSEGTSNGTTTTDTDSTVTDTSVNLISKTTKTKIHYERTAEGRYESSSESEASGAFSGTSSSTGSDSSTEDGTYTVSSNSTVDFKSLDKTAELTKDSKFLTTETYDGSGTYSSSSTVDRSSAGDGSYSSSTVSDSSTSDSGTRTYDSNSVTTATGTETLAPDVTREVTKASDSYHENRSGTSTSTSKKYSESSNINGTAKSFSSEDTTHDESGTTAWDQVIDSDSTTTNLATAKVDRTEKNTTHYAADGTGTYSKTFKGFSGRASDGSWSNSTEGEDHSSGTSGHDRTVNTESTVIDKSKQGITRDTDTDSQKEENGSSTWYSDTVYSTEQSSAGLNKSSTDTKSGSETTGSTTLDKVHENVIVNQPEMETDDGGNYDYEDSGGNGTAAAITKKVTSFAHSERWREGTGTFTATSTSNSNVTDGVTTSDTSYYRIDDGTFTNKLVTDEDVTVTEKTGDGGDPEDPEAEPATLDRFAHTKRHSEENSSGTSHSESGNWSETFADKTSTSSQYSKYSEEGSYSSNSEVNRDGHAKQYTSKKNDAYNETPSDTSKDVTSITGAFSSKREDLSEQLANGKSTSFHMDEKYSDATEATTSSERTTVVKTHSKTAYTIGKEETTVTTDTNGTTKTKGNDTGKWTSWVWNQWSTDAAGKTTTLGDSKDTSEGTYTWNNSETSTADKSNPDGATKETWNTTVNQSNSGSGKYSSLSTTHTAGGVTSSDSTSSDESTGNYSSNTTSAHTLKQADAIVDMGDGSLGIGKGTSTNNTSYVTSGKLHVVTSSKSTDSGAGSWVREKTVTDEDKGTSTWSETSTLSGEKNGSLTDGSAVKTDTNNSTSVSGTDNYDTTTTTATTSSSSAGSTLTITKNGSGDGTSTWNDTTNEHSHADQSVGDGTSDTTKTSTDSGSGNHKSTYNWTTIVDAEGSTTTGSQTNTIDANGNFTKARKHQTDIPESTRLGWYGMEIKRTVGKIEEDTTTGNFTSTGSLTTTIGADGKTSRSGSVTTKTHTDVTASKTRHVTDKWSGSGGLWYREINWDESTQEEMPFIDPQTPTHTGKVTDKRGASTHTVTDTTNTETYNSDGSTTLDSTTKSKVTLSNDLHTEWDNSSQVSGRPWRTFNKGHEESKVGTWVETVDGKQDGQGSSIVESVSQKSQGGGFGYDSHWFIPSGPPAMNIDFTHERTAMIEEGADQEHIEESEDITIKWGNSGPEEWLFEEEGGVSQVGKTNFHSVGDRNLSTGVVTLTEHSATGSEEWIGWDGSTSGYSFTEELIDADTIHYEYTNNSSGGTLPPTGDASSSWQAEQISDRLGLAGRSLEYGWGDQVFNWFYDQTGIDIDDVEEAAIEAGQTTIDGLAGAVDGLADGLNPLSSIYDIPDIGPIYGHSTAYGAGQIVGEIGGNIALNYFTAGAGGSIRCVMAAGKVARVVGWMGKADDAYNVVQSGSVIANGEAGVGDYLSLGLSLLSLFSSSSIKCFIGGTEVLTGTTDQPGVFSETKIEDIKVGNLVWAKDDENPDAPLSLKRVTQLYQSTAYDLQKLSVRNEDGNVETLTSSDGHPYYVVGRGWTYVEDLRPGDVLASPDGREQVVIANADDKRPDGVPVFNFEVEDNHTYFVADGQNNDSFVWVHNKSDCDPPASLLRNAKGKALAKNNDVYYGLSSRSGKPIYVGITRQDLDARHAQHLASGKNFRRLVPINEEKLTRRQARAIEQALIDRNPFFKNRINSIDPSKPWYDDAMNWAKRWLTENNI